MKLMVLWTLLLLVFNSTNKNTKLIITVLQAVILSTIMAQVSASPWMAYFICMTFAGGLMILFIYILSTLNKTFTKTHTLSKTLLLFMTVTLVVPSTSTMEASTSIMKNITMSGLFSDHSLTLLTFITLFLLAVLIITMHICSEVNSSIRMFK